MNIKQVKEKFTLQSVLSTLGYHPDKKKSKGNDLWYISPFRSSEKTPSFHIDTRNYFYKDFGETEKGGDLIWFAQMYLKHLGKGYSVSDALKWFDEIDTGTNIHYFNKKADKEPAAENKEETYKVLSDKEIFSSVLEQYLERKTLPLELSKKYLRQIYFLNQKTNKKLFGLGFKTRAGGFDIRTANGFKTMIGNKDITVVKGNQSQNTLDVFEGVSDFLTMLAIESRDVPRYDCVILNSANLYEKAVEYAKQGNYRYVKLWLDNDEAGRKFEAAFIQSLQDVKPDITFSRMNHIYEEFKDLNAWHTGCNINLSSKKNILLDFVKPLDVKISEPDKLQA